MVGPACAGLGRAPDGVEAPSTTPTADPGDARGSAPPRSSRTVRRASSRRQPRFHGSGAGRHGRPAPLVTRRHAWWLAPPLWLAPHAWPGPARRQARVTELRPNPIRSDTSRHRTAGAPAGGSDAARRCPAEAGQGVSDDPVRRTHSCEQDPPGPDGGRSACAVPTPIRTEGRFLRFSAKRTELG